MSSDANKLSRLWNELKRRKVIHVITIYASAAFGIIEIINNLAEPLHMPNSVSTIVIIVFAVGFPFAVILSWLYDLTSGSFERTRPMEEIQAEEKAKVPDAWKIATYISFVVIIGLVVLNIAGKGNVIKPGMIQSMVILPFDNYTGDEQLDYFVSGMHSSLNQEIGKIGGLRVISETSSKVYKNVIKSVPEIASELNVDAVVEAQVLCLGDTVCLQVKVVKADREEKQLWVGDYREDKSQILNLYNRITRQIANEIRIKLTPEEKLLLARSRIVDRDAYDEYLKARSYWDDFSRESLNKALEFLNSAVEKEPDWAPLYSGLAQVWMGIQQMGFESPSVTSPEIYENLDKALELDPDLSDSHYFSAMIAHLMEWNWEKSEKEFLKALGINPSDALSRIFYAQFLLILQRTDEALAQGQIAINLDPLNLNMKIWYAALLAGAGDFKTSLAYGEEVVEADPENYMGNNIIECAAYRCKDYNKVIKAVKYCLPFSIEEGTFKEIERIFDEQGIVAAYREIMKHLEKFAENNPISIIDMSLRYIMADQPDKAMDWIEKGFEIHDPQMTYITTHMYNLEPLFNNPRFIDIVKKMNLPLPKN